MDLAFVDIAILNEDFLNLNRSRFSQSLGILPKCVIYCEELDKFFHNITLEVYYL